jgi:hypothetical protein
MWLSSLRSTLIFLHSVGKMHGWPFPPDAKTLQLHSPLDPAGTSVGEFLHFLRTRNRVGAHFGPDPDGA